MHDKQAFGKAIEELLDDFETHLERGLTSAQAQRRLEQFGANELTERPRPGFLALLWDQFKNFLVIILIIAAAISLALGEYVDSFAIMFIVLLKCHSNVQGRQQGKNIGLNESNQQFKQSHENGKSY